MASKLDDLLSKIRARNDSGLSFTAIKTAFADKSKDREADVREKLASLLREGAISGPFKHRGSQLYFAAGCGPSVETASQAIVSLVSKSGVKLLSKPTLTKKVTGMNARLFPDGLKHAVASQAIVELSCGSSKYYLHRDVAADYFGFEAASGRDNGDRTEQLIPEASGPRLTLENLLPAYRRLKAEQGGFSAVKIFDLMKALDGSKEDLHRLLVEEAKAGRVTIHPTTSVELPAEVIDAGIRLPGFSEPFVTVVVKNEP
jgi:hypothetical protein